MQLAKVTRFNNFVFGHVMRSFIEVCSKLSTLSMNKKRMKVLAKTGKVCQKNVMVAPLFFNFGNNYQIHTLPSSISAEFFIILKAISSKLVHFFSMVYGYGDSLIEIL